MTPRPTRSQRTIDELRAAARTLAMTQPIAEITAEDIAEAAGVSRRTFFNYFPSTSEAFLPAVGNDPELLERIAAGEPENFADCLAAVVCSRANAIARLCQEYPGYFSATVCDPHMRTLLMNERYSLDADLRQALARRLNRNQDDSLVNILAHTTFIIEFEVLHRIDPADAATAEVQEKIQRLTYQLAETLSSTLPRK